MIEEMDVPDFEDALCGVTAVDTEPGDDTWILVGTGGGRLSGLSTVYLLMKECVVVGEESSEGMEESKASDQLKRSLLSCSDKRGGSKLFGRWLAASARL
jgi:hypothetical protein